MRMPSWNFRGGKSLGGGGGGATGLCVKAKASFPCGAVCCLRTFVGHLTNCSSPPLSSLNYCQLYCNACRNASRLQH